MLEKLEAVFSRFQEVETLLSSPEIVSDRRRFTQLNKEYKSLQPVVAAYHRYKHLTEEYTEAREILKNEKDKELKELALESVAQAEQEMPALE